MRDRRCRPSRSDEPCHLPLVVGDPTQVPRRVGIATAGKDRPVARGGEGRVARVMSLTPAAAQCVLLRMRGHGVTTITLRDAALNHPFAKAFHRGAAVGRELAPLLLYHANVPATGSD